MILFSHAICVTGKDAECKGLLLLISLSSHLLPSHRSRSILSYAGCGRDGPVKFLINYYWHMVACQTSSRFVSQRRECGILPILAFQPTGLLSFLFFFIFLETRTLCGSTVLRSEILNRLQSTTRRHNCWTKLLLGSVNSGSNHGCRMSLYFTEPLFP